MTRIQILIVISLSHFLWLPALSSQELVGTSVIPHRFSNEMRWRRPPEPQLSAKTELFILNSTDSELKISPDAVRFDGLAPADLLETQDWSWHDTPSVWTPAPETIPSGALFVMKINGRSSDWGIGTQHQLSFGEGEPMLFPIQAPSVLISSVTCLHEPKQNSESTSFRPNRLCVFIENRGADTVDIETLTVWRPQAASGHHFFYPTAINRGLSPFPRGGIPADSKGGFTLSMPSMQLGYAVLQVGIRKPDGSKESLWGHVRVRAESFDISGGWVSSNVNGQSSLLLEPYRKTLRRMHINTGQIQEVAGFTDQPDLYADLPLKRFNRLEPMDRYDTDAMLPTVHAVEFLGEPQYGGGKPVPPQQVWEALAPYQNTRLPTSLTLSEERTWRYYAGLSDFPHYDAYRITAPAADSWTKYDRWGDERIRWGAPLETIGTMTRSLRHHSQPAAIAYWSQGAHHGWGSRWTPRRGSPTPDELRAQAWHGLSNRVTSLYWFNLSLKSLVKFPDLIEPITRVNREALAVAPLLLHGDAFEYRRIIEQQQPEWDLNSIATPDSLLMFAHDLAYVPDPEAREFKFSPRDGEFVFKRPSWLSGDLKIYRIDADGIRSIQSESSKESIVITDEIHVVGIYIATTDASLKETLEAKLASLREIESATGFDPGNNAEDFKKLESLLQSSDD